MDDTAASTLASLKEEFLFEDPADAWLELVEACRIVNETTRKSQVARMIFIAKNSQWTRELWKQELDPILEHLDNTYQAPLEQDYRHPDDAPGSEPDTQ